MWRSLTCICLAILLRVQRREALASKNIGTRSIGAWIDVGGAVVNIDFSAGPIDDCHY